MIGWCYRGEMVKVMVYLVDATDGYTPKIDVASPTIYITKNGGTPAPPNDGTWTQLDSTNMPGWYTVQLDGTDTNTVGEIGGDVIKSGVTRHFPFTLRVRESPSDSGLRAE